MNMQTEIIKRNNSSSYEVDLIEVREGKAVTSSLVVAEYFGKAHKDVLRAIKSLDCSELFNQRNFAPVEYVDKKGEKRPMYYLTRDGFTFWLWDSLAGWLHNSKKRILAPSTKWKKCFARMIAPSMPKRYSSPN